MRSSPDRHEIVRRAHQQAVLSAVLTGGPISRGTIVATTGLSKPVVLGIVAELAEAGMIVPQGRVIGGVGRAPTLWVANARAAFVAGVDLGGTKLRAALADLDGAVIVETVHATDRHGGSRVGDQIADVVKSLARTAKVRLDLIATVAVGSPGVADDEGRMQLASNVAGLGEFSLRGHLQRRFPNATVIVENDVNVAAMGERAEGSGVGCNDLVVLSVGTGIGAGVIVGGVLVRGHHGAAGEVAWLPIGEPADSREARRRGALETAAAGVGVRRRLAQALTERPGSALNARASVVEIFAAAALGDAAAREVVETEAQLVAKAVVSLAATLDPERVVLAGGIGSNPDLLPLVRAELERIAPFPIEVETSKLGERSGIVGALTVARSTARQRVFHELTDAER